MLLTNDWTTSQLIKECACVCPLCPQRIAALTGQPITWEKITVPRRRTSHLRQKHCGPDPPTTYRDSFTSPAKDKSQADSSVAANHQAQTKDPALTLPLGLHSHLKSHDPDDLSTCSDLESGVADLSSRSSSGGEDRKDPDSDEAVFTTTWVEKGNAAVWLEGERKDGCWLTDR